MDNHGVPPGDQDQDHTVSKGWNEYIKPMWNEYIKPNDSCRTPGELGSQTKQEPVESRQVAPACLTSLTSWDVGHRPTDLQTRKHELTVRGA